MSDYRRWIKAVIKEVEKVGWSASINGHIKFKGPNGQVICCSFTPKNETQVMHSVRRDFKRIGVLLES